MGGEDLKALKEGFDVRAFLDDRGVAYSLEGDNVTAGWLGIECRFCSDHARHLGVHYAGDNGFHCWLCDESGDAISFIKAVEGCGFLKAKEILEQYQGKGLVEQKVRVDYHSRVLPDECILIDEGMEPEIVRRWFKRRGFPRSLCREWGLGFCEFGPYNLRLIVPVTLDGRVVSFQAVDLSGWTSDKYRSCPDGRSNRPLKHCLYGIDEAARGDQIILVEGVTDKWRLGNSAVALFGKGWTLDQMLLLWERAGSKRIKVLLDLDAMEDGDGLSWFLTERFARVEFVKLEEGDPKDPGEFNDDWVRKVVAA